MTTTTRPLSRPAAVALVLTLVITILTTLPASATETVIRVGDRLDAAAVTVQVGDAVTWVNEDDERHRIRSRSEVQEFDSGDLEPGDRFTVTLRIAGDIRYGDERNDDDPAYAGTIRVEDPATGGGTEPDGGGTTTGGATGGSGTTGGGTTGGTTSAPVAADVTVGDRIFTPGTVTIGVGGTITWTNRDDRDHTATGDGWDSGLVGPGGTYRHRFDTAGTFTYRCLLHPDMTGTVRVAAADGSAPPLAPSTLAPQPSPTGAPDAAAPSPSAGTASTSPGVRTVRVVDLAFDPARLSVPAGTRVRWRNDGQALHTVTAPSFDSGMLSPGASFERTLSTPGTLAIRCRLHPEMTAVIEVGAAGASTGGALPDASDPGPPSDAPTSADEAAAEDATVDVDVVDLAFEPDPVQLPLGATARWSNRGAAPHTVTADDGAFASDVLATGDTFTWTADTTGTFTYHCAVHPDMTGSVEVVAAGSEVTHAGDEDASRPSSSRRAVAAVTAGASTSASAGWWIVVAILGLPLLLLAAGARLYRAAEDHPVASASSSSSPPR